jgi:signal transduction histidine kinase
MSSPTLNTYDALMKDIQKVNQISIVPTILEVICKTTGMGFAAVARVTKEKWIACSVRDEIQFGLTSGGELEIQTTICNEIRDSGKLVVIDHVSEDIHFCNHHTPRMYGFQSYISVPIILKTGEFFGTLCSIDPKPASLNNAKTIGMFNLFADLISFHLQSLDLMEQSQQALQELNQQLVDTKDENRQYHYISHHNLQEPLRKISIFSDLLITASQEMNAEKTKAVARKIGDSAQRFSAMMKKLSEFSNLSYGDHSFVPVELGEIISSVCLHLKTQAKEKGAEIIVGPLPVIYGIPLQIEQLFYHLISNALKFTKESVQPVIKINSTEVSNQSLNKSLHSDQSHYIQVQVADNGIGIENSELKRIFDIFSQSNFEPGQEGFGIGLAYCYKIVRLHLGVISVQSKLGEGTIFSVVLPLKQFSQ